MTRREWLACAAALPPAASQAPAPLDFSRLIPRRLPRSAAFRDPGAHLWDPAMVRTPDGVCHLLYSRWPKALGFDGWATHAEIAWATSDRPEGPYRFRKTVLPARGSRHWDGHSVYNTCLLFHAGQYYLYYTGNRGTASWRPDRALTVKDEDWWTQRNAQRIGIAVAGHPGGPWRRFDQPLIDTGPETGDGIIAVPNVIARPGGGFLMVYKTLLPGPGRLGGGVVHYPALAASPRGPFRRHARQMVDKQKLLGVSTKFNFHVDDHLEWFQDDRYYAIVKDHDAPYLTPHGRALLLFESADGLEWRPSRHTLALDFSLEWEDGGRDSFERLEMPKLHFENGRPKTLFLAARLKGDPAANSFLVVVPLKEARP